jgi:hypothetical protein
MRITQLGLLGVLAVAACGGDDSNTNVDAPPGTPDAPPGTADARPSVFDVSGTVVGPAAAAGPIIAAWPVDGAGGDSIYKFGDGSSANGTAFTAGLPGDPPAAARNQFGGDDFGVGFLVLLPPGTSYPDGPLATEPPVVGISARQAIIYRGATDTGGIVPWTTAFPVGLSCGVCVDSTTGFDSYAPADCATFVIDTDPDPDVCNWM